jgi:DNA-binding transcriptional LysR family regulator
MELRHLRYFLTVAEELHFGRAAERLFICQPPLSQQIQQLEREMGIRLFDRTNRRVQLTAAGEAFRLEAVKVLEQCSRAVLAAQRAHRGESGRLAVGYVGSASYTAIPRSILAFGKSYPGVKLALCEMTTPEQIAALLDNRIDVGILRSANLGREELRERPVLRENFVAALPQAHPLAQQKTVTVNALADEGFVLYPQNSGPGLYQQVMGLCLRAGFSPRPAQQASQIPTIISLVAAGLGVALVPASIQSLRWKGVAYRPLKDAKADTAVVLAWRRDTRSPIVRTFADSISHAAELATGIHAERD